MVLQQLMHCESDFDMGGAAGGQPWDGNATLVLVVCYLHHVEGPLSWFVQEIISTAQALGLLRHTQASNAQVQVVDTLCGPTVEHAHILLHRRTCRTADMHRGIQHCERRYYYAASRARQSSTIWLDAEPFGTPDHPLDPFVPSPQVAAKRFHENIRMVVQSQKLDHQVLWPDGDPQWDNDLKLPWWISKHFAPGQQEPARCALNKADKSWRTSPPQELRQCSFVNLKEVLTHRAVAQLADHALEEAHQFGTCQAGNTPPRCDPHPPAELVSNVWPTLASEGFELGHILVDGIVVKQWGKQGLHLTIPCLCLDKGQEWPQLGNSLVAQGEPMVQALVALSGVVRGATRKTGRLLSKIHRANIRDTPGWSWWSHQHNTDREATLLVNTMTATTTGAQGAHVYAYVGGGSLSSASGHLLQCIVAETCDWEAGAAVMAGSSDHASRGVCLDIDGWASQVSILSQANKSQSSLALVHKHTLTQTCCFRPCQTALRLLSSPARSLRASSHRALPMGTLWASTPNFSSLVDPMRKQASQKTALARVSLPAFVRLVAPLQKLPRLTWPSCAAISTSSFCRISTFL
jgi:hypothetical protein